MKTRFLFWAALGLTIVGVRSAPGQGPPDPREFLKRLDANGNGMIDPDELEGRFGGFIRRMAEGNSRIDLSRPIPLDRMAEEFTRMRDERMRSGGFGGGPSFGGGPPGSSGGHDHSRDGGSGGPPSGPWQGGPPGGPGGPWQGGTPGGDQNSPYAPRDIKMKPLVAGFGLELPTTPAPGFGGQTDFYNVKITDDDRREAERSFRHYDSNNDGKIDASEMSRSQYGRDLPVFDRNHDGVITMNEMEIRYARRRIENERDSRSRPAGDRRDDRGGRDSERGRDGERSRDRGRDGERGRDGGSREGDGESAAAEMKKSFLPRTSTRQLPKDVPDWFASSDKNNDGQIAMGEFAADWGESTLADFNKFDLNRDGLITPAEAIKAAKAGASRSGGSSSAASSSGSKPSAPGGPSGPAASGVSPSGTPGATAAAPATPAPAASGAALPPVDARYLEYFKKVVAKYDTNHDGELTANEWSAMSKNPEAADLDRNGRVSVEEYARWSTQK